MCLQNQASLKPLREVTKAHGAVLIFDEVMVASALVAGVHKNVSISNQILHVLVKSLAVACHLLYSVAPVRLWNQIAPAGPIYQAGTLSGNPIAVTSGLATLSILQRTQRFLNK